jgi:hypothetical protein
VVTKVEMHKKMIRTVIIQLPQFITQYSSADQVLLNSFLKVLQCFEEADNKRADLIDRFTIYCQQLYRTEKYLHTTFLWFSNDYIQKAGLLLSVANFQGIKFYEYLAKHLRSRGDSPGVFELIRRNVPLTDLAWEQLQHSCQQLSVPLTEEQIQNISITYDIIQKQGIYALNSQKFKQSFLRQEARRDPSIRELNRFFNIIEGRWSLRFHSPAFGLERLFCRIKLEKASQLNEIFDLHQEANTTLNISEMYQVRNNAKHYLGILFVPSNDIDKLVSYLTLSEKNNLGKLLKLEKIIESYRNVSLKYYRRDKGWIHRKPTLLINQKEIHDDDKEQSYAERPTLHYISPPFNKTWSFHQHRLSSRILQTYCDTPHSYSFSSLPLSSQGIQAHTKLSQSEIGLLKFLHSKNVLNVNFVPWRLVYEFSLNQYWIIIPKKPISKLKSILEYIPFCEVYLTENSVCIWAHLTEELIVWIERELQGETYLTIQTKYPIAPQFTWVDIENKKWQTPAIFHRM